MTMRWRHVFLTSLLLLGLSSKIALACVTQETPQEAFALSSHVFIGKPVEENCTYDVDLRRDVLTTQFKVYDVWKGNIPKSFFMKTYAFNNCSDLKWHYKKEEKYLIYTRPSLAGGNGILTGFNMCGRTQILINDTKENLDKHNSDLKYLGNPIISYGEE